MKAKILIFLIFGHLLGNVLGYYISIDNDALRIIIFSLVCSVLVSMRNRYIATIILLLLSIFSGLYFYSNQLNTFQNLNDIFSDREVKISGIVDEIPTKNEHGFTAKVKIISLNEQKNSSRLIGYFPTNNAPKYNEKIEFSGEIKRYTSEKTGYFVKEKVIGEISIKEYQSLGQAETRSLKYYLYQLRMKFNETISRSLPKDEADLASGLILGEKANFNNETRRNLQAAGVTHIIALSGYNITIILRLLKITERKLSRLINLLLPLFLITFFIIMTGASASIVRAGIMGFMPILAQYVFRPRNSVLAVMISAFLMVLINPFILLHDVGFQLSFVALLGIMYLAPILVGDLSKTNIVKNLLAETLGAQLAVLPLLIFYFGSFSIISPVSNIFILSLVPLGMLVSFLVGFFGMLMTGLGFLTSIPAYAVLSLTNRLINFFGKLPFSMVQYKFGNPLWLLVLYLALINVVLVLKRGKAH